VGAVSGKDRDSSSSAASGRERSTTRLVNRDTSQLTASRTRYQPTTRTEPCGRCTTWAKTTMAATATRRGTRTQLSRMLQANAFRDRHS